jgi:hypothetical protein
MARDWLTHELEHWEKHLADGGCADESGFSETPNGLNNQDQRMKADARARHETANGRLKRWGVLERRFRHRAFLHGKVFQSIANTTQLEIQMNSPLFSVDCFDG